MCHEDFYRLVSFGVNAAMLDSQYLTDTQYFFALSTFQGGSFASTLSIHTLKEKEKGKLLENYLGLK